MVQVRCPDGKVVEADGPVALGYYQREPGYEVLGDLPPEVETVETVELVAPAESAVKAEWVDFALTVDPTNAEWINDHSTTKDDLIEKYGG